MKTLNLAVIAFLSVTFLSSCSNQLTYFSQYLYDEYRWPEQDLKKIQFYISRDIVLKRQLTGGSSEIISGKIKIEVIIRKGTPGAFIFSPKHDSFAISFEEGGDSPYLMFGPNPKYNGRYALLASEWKRGGGQVTYAGKKWRVSTDDAFAALLVDMRKIDKVSVNSRVAKGRTVD
ncbi:MAG: hypothetical protein ACE5FF_04715 [Saprospiraceae bacterium]